MLPREQMAEEKVKKIIDSLYPEEVKTMEPGEFTTLWEDAVKASAAPTFGAACAALPGREDIAVQIHMRNPWMPTPEEVRVLRAWMPGYVRMALETFRSAQKLSVMRWSRIVGTDAELTKEFVVHLEEMGKAVQEKSTYPGA